MTGHNGAIHTRSQSKIISVNDEPAHWVSLTKTSCTAVVSTLWSFSEIPIPALHTPRVFEMVGERERDPYNNVDIQIARRPQSVTSSHASN